MMGYKKLFVLFWFVLISMVMFSLRIWPESRNNSVLQNTQDQAVSARLAAVLKRAEIYCRRLDQAALDFVCLEEVTEMTRHFTPKTDVYLYDYQFIRKDNKVKEQRNLIAVNGKKTDIQDSSLDTFVFQYKNVLFGPIGLLSQYWQAYHDFKFIGEDTLNKEKVLVVEATPGANLTQPHCYGKLWIKEDDGSVLKIVWDQRSLGNFKSIEEWAESHGAKPEITAYCEFGFEKNGIRFPSRSYTENAYIDKNNRKFVNAEISILYKDYKFFTVETEIKYDE
jgi:hypothetical protein